MVPFLYPNHLLLFFSPLEHTSSEMTSSHHTAASAAPISVEYVPATQSDSGNSTPVGSCASSRAASRASSRAPSPAGSTTSITKGIKRVKVAQPTSDPKDPGTTTPKVTAP